MRHYRFNPYEFPAIIRPQVREVVELRHGISGPWEVVDIVEPDPTKTLLKATRVVVRRPSEPDFGGAGVPISYIAGIIGSMIPTGTPVTALI